MPDNQSAAREYRKTATIKATQWWKMGDHPAVILKSDPRRYADEGIPWIETLEGGHVVTPGDWIATGVNGEHWPIKPDVFAKTYEPVDAKAQPAATRKGDFRREDRYIVVKRKNLNAVQETALRAHIARLQIGTVECVVVESDWPEYEPVWRMIEARAVLTSSDSPVVGEDCTCQRHPTHCANDCPQHGLSEPTYTAGERIDIPPTPTDTADRSCTCHPDDRPEGPCPKKFAASECTDTADRREAVARIIALDRTPEAPLSATDPWDWNYWTRKNRDSIFKLADAIASLIAGPPDDALVERMARFACEWEDADPDASLGGDGQNFRWMETANTLIRPLLAMIAGRPGEPA